MKLRISFFWMMVADAPRQARLGPDDSALLEPIEIEVENGDANAARERPMDTSRFA